MMYLDDRGTMLTSYFGIENTAKSRLCVIAACIGLAACGNASPNDIIATDARGAIRPSEMLAMPAQTPAITRPVIFNAPASARAGDIIYLQGANFGASPTVVLGSTRQRLRIVNRFGNWISVQIPAGTGEGLSLRVVDGVQSSDRVWLNAPQIHGFDSLTTVPGGRFRIFGRNLMMGKRVPTLWMNGVAAAVDAANSDSYNLSVRAPAGINPTSQASVVIDNGNGSGPIRADGTMEVLAGKQATAGAAEVFGGRTGWLALFAPFQARTLDVDCNNGRPVGQAIQDAVDQLNQSGGGTVRIGAGLCVLERGVTLADGTILQGAGQKATELRYQADYPLWAEKRRGIAIRNLTLTNAGNASEGPLLHKSRFVLLQNVTMNFGRQKQSFFDENANILVTGCIFNQQGSIGQQSPYLFSGSQGLIFEKNVTRLIMGASAFERVSDAMIAHNLFRRDDSQQDAPGALHMMTIDFASRIAIMGNIFDTANGPITNRSRNDGEAILTEGGGPVRTENVGTVQAGSARTMTDSGLMLKPGPYSGLTANHGIAIVSGTGAGQTRTITGFFRGLVTVDRPWDVIPERGSRYATFRWGLEKAVIRANVFNQMPRGIWLYQAAIRDVAVIENRFVESGGIYLRSYQNLATGMFDPIYNVTIENNVVSNAAQSWPSYMTSVFVNADARAFGIAMLGIVFRNNRITAHDPPFELNAEEYAGNEGYFAMMRVENYTSYESAVTPRILGTIFQNNGCSFCAYSYRIGTGTGGAVIAGARGTIGVRLLDDWKTTKSQERAVGTRVE